MNLKKLTALVLGTAVLTGCTGTAAAETKMNQAETAAEIQLPFSVDPDEEDFEEVYDESTAARIVLDGETAEITGTGASFENGTLTIAAPGEYVLSGSLNGSVYVNSESAGTVHLVLANAVITAKSGAAIHIAEADKTIITAYRATENTVTDSETYDASDEASAAVYSKDDLVINGSGKLTVSGLYKNGIHSKDDLYILSTNLEVSAVNDGLKGKDVLYLSGSDVTVTSFGDGLCASNDTDPESGNLLIDSSTVTVTAEDDAIQAVTYLAVRGGTIHVTAGGGAGEAVNPMGGFDPSFSNQMPGMDQPGSERPEMPTDGSQPQMPSDFNGEMPEMPQGGFGGQRPEGFDGQRPDQPQGMGPGGMNPSDSERPEMPADGSQPQMPSDFNGEMPQMPQGGFEGEMPEMPTDGFMPDENGMPVDEQTDSSEEKNSKGFKADGSIYVLGGEIFADCADDAFNANSDLYVAGGTLDIKTGDDGLHADGKLLIQAGTVRISQSKEGLEAFEIVIEGGTVDVTASDDGINASDPEASGTSMEADSSSLVISGGEITLDTSGDGIDTNGSGLISGGTLTVYGPVMGAESALDHNGSFVINGGTVLAGGASGMVELPEESSENLILSIGTSSGDIEIRDKDGNTLAVYSSQKNYSHLIYSSGDLKKGQTYTVYENGSELGTVTLENTITSLNFSGGTMNGPQQMPSAQRP